MTLLRVAFGISLLCLINYPLEAQDRMALGVADPCLETDVESRFGVSDLYCINLTAVPALEGAGGLAILRPATSPYGVAVTRDGHHRHRLELHIKGLPRPSSLGDYTTFVAWATTPEFDPLINLGQVDNGTYSLGEVAFNKFILLISAEASGDGLEREGRLVMRGLSPSSKMEAHDLAIMAPLALNRPADTGNDHDGHHGMMQDEGWMMPPMHPQMQMLPGMMSLRPEVDPFLPADTTVSNLPEAEPRKRVALQDGDSFSLETHRVQRTLGTQALQMYGFNRQYPGPLLDVPQDAEIEVNFTNKVDLPSAIHWHGLRLDYRHDGVPGLTQDLVPPGGTHAYRLTFPDPGIYWFHPHFREDIKMDLGLYANIVVRSSDPNYFNPVDREDFLVFDDLLMDDRGVVPYGSTSSNYMLMGRFGNTFLINGISDYSMEVNQGDIVRLFLTNSSNTRTYNLVFGDTPIKLIGSDVGKFEQESWVESVVIAPAERYIVELLFDKAGDVAITNRVQSINHRTGVFFPEVDTLGSIAVAPSENRTASAASFFNLRAHEDVAEDLAAFRPYFDSPIDKRLHIKLEADALPDVVKQVMRFDAVYFNPVEWSGTMPMMNWASTGEEVQWILEDPETGKQNMAIDWRFQKGDVVKIQLVNDRESFHAMQHPIHIHGQRFLVLERDGIRQENLVWKDTTILPSGSTATLLMDTSNPGKWMVHCHIAEHIDSGMMFVFDVED